MKHNSTDGVDGRPWSVYQHSPGCFSVARTKGDDLKYSSDKTLTEPEARRRCDALNAGVGVPAFDPTQPCDMQRLRDGWKPGFGGVPTMCMRCKNPHHACDGGGVVVPPATLPESMSRDEMLRYYSEYANMVAHEVLGYQKRIRDLEAALMAAGVPDPRGVDLPDGAQHEDR